MRGLIFYIVLPGFLLAIGSCKPAKEMYAPEIIFVEPAAGHIVDLPDTLDVQVRISDERLIRTAVLTMVNADKIPVIPANYYYPDSAEYLIKASLPLVDKSLASGPYNLLVTVSDGTDQKNQYLQIMIEEIPLQLQAYIVVTAQFDFKSTIIKLNPAFETDTQFVFPHGFCLSAIQSIWGEFIFVTGEPSVMVSFNPETFENEWEMAAAPPRPLITALIADQELVFSTANGDAGILSSDGSISLRTQAFDDKTIQCLAADDKYIYAAHVSLSGDIRELTVFSRLTGSIWEQRLISGEIRSLVPAANNLLVFLQLPGGAKIMDYDPRNFILTELNQLPEESITSTVKIFDGEVIILTDSRVISFYPVLNQAVNFKDQSYKIGRYDPLNDEIFLVRDTILYGYKRNTGELMDEKSFPQEIMDFQILYNK